MFGAYVSEIRGVLGEMVRVSVGYAIVLLLVSKFVNSRGSGAGGRYSRRAGYRYRSALYRGLCARHVMATISCRPASDLAAIPVLTVPAQPVLAALRH